MMPNVTRGDRMAGLVMYLAGPGRANEHTNPRLIAGHDMVTFAVAPGKDLSRDDALDIANVLDAPRKQHGTSVQVPVREFDEEQSTYVTTGYKDAHVWHCSLALKADEGKLSDELWAEIAYDFVEGMGFIDPDGAKSSRWAAIHHGDSRNGNDHIHIAVQMVREDGTKADVHFDKRRSQKVVGEIEKKRGLVVLESRDKSRGLAGDKPAERSTAQRNNQAMPAPVELRRRMRAALSTSSSQHEYVQRLMDSGVRVAPRFAKGSTDHVVGYRVGIAPEKGSSQQTIYYAPSKIDRTLGWPYISARFNGEGREGADRLLRGIRSGSIAQPDRASKVHDFEPRRAQQLMAGNAAPDALANIYARVSMSMEKDKPGVFHQLSENYARAAQSGGNASHALRLGARFASKNSARSWLAVLQQANRLARAMTDDKLASNRPQLTAATLPALAQADRIIRAELIRMQKENASSSVAAPTKEPTTRTPMSVHRPQGWSADRGHGR
ncbi:relaxase/mobilization nuclease domain-containing protein [Nesterenkonia lutea]|uniref:MobA/VirD2-like nuclease domain-containing protein n=1 Tax=Nesterenkonia lutea TaxID=272919 RepID=A0ABR9JJ11_9MICC|nr:relaxase/mobilization nuclease domain-containing protein [Nesterenkonia lutea]MBE1525522.1 hypothetical protein [Nesterenkonia lutea]